MKRPIEPNDVYTVLINIAQRHGTIWAIQALLWGRENVIEDAPAMVLEEIGDFVEHFDLDRDVMRLEQSRRSKRRKKL